MNTARLEAFSDAVLAIIITITVLGLRVPQGGSLAALLPLLPVFLIYIWSFQTVGTYWNNHHHLMLVTEEVNTWIMWANLHLLFWLSLIPFATEWLGTHIGQTWPTAVYCVVLLFAAVAYTLLEWAIVARHGTDSRLATSLGNDTKGKITLAVQAASVAIAFVYPYLSYFFFVAVAAMWFVPDRRVTLKLAEEEPLQ